MRIARCIVWVISICSTVCAQDQRLFKQQSNSSAVELLSTSERSELDDPLFTLVLKDHADAVNLKEILDLLQPDGDERRLFVVDERIKDPQDGQLRRAVIDFRGFRGPIRLNSNVMLSVSFNSEDFPTDPTSGIPAKRLRFVEAWGWDNHRRRYNYYRLDEAGSGGAKLTWKFRGSSQKADLLSPDERSGTCMACHINGAPVMKELLRPWNNWHSIDSPTNYLNPSQPVNVRWPVTTHPLMQNLTGAESLEQSIIAAISNFATAQVNRGLLRSDNTGNVVVRNGQVEVVQASRLLRHLFVTTEFNIISADRRTSNLHPIPEANETGPADAFAIPSTFFLNADLIAGGGPSGLDGLKIDEARAFLGRDPHHFVQPDEYKRLVKQSQVQIDGKPGDAHFCWLIPAPSHMDDKMIDTLMKRGLVTPHFVAAVLAVDLRNPILSEKRASLLRFCPDRYSFSEPANEQNRFDIQRHRDHELTKKVIEAIEAFTPDPGSTEAEFLAILRGNGETPIERLRQQIEAYEVEVGGRLAEPATRATELTRLYGLVLQSRRRVLNDPVLGSLDETGGRLLFPLPPD